jgi:hypothetical protein
VDEQKQLGPEHGRLHLLIARFGIRRVVQQVWHHVGGDIALHVIPKSPLWQIRDAVADILQDPREFDAGNREVCMIRRGRTNTPLQAFVTLNDPVFIETHQAMARRVIKEASDTLTRLKLMFKLCVSREPTTKEITALTRLHDESLTSYQTDLEAAAKMANDPIGPAPKDANLPDLAAWTTVANVVMNLDEFLMRR